MRRDPLILGLICLTAVVYGQTCWFEFVSLDDSLYVTKNPAVREGLSLPTVRWAWTSSLQTGNWHPLTWLSLMLDSQVFGPANSGAFHFTNALLHTANTVLLYLALSRMTLRRWPSALVAALFAVHPLHVESVAWVSERKDVLSTFFGFLSWLWYVNSLSTRGLIPGSIETAPLAVRTPLRGVAYSWLSVVAFVCSLLSKPMLVTWPFVLLLLDVWPLRRTERWRTLAWEKWPYFAAAIAFSIVAIFAQRQGGAIRNLGEYPLWARCGNALTSYGLYLLKTVWPVRLGVFYPHPGTALPVWHIALATAAILLVTVFCWSRRKSEPMWLVGWLWFLGTLVPVIGLVQVGNQQLADRYMYVPLVGLLLAVVFGGSSWRVFGGMRGVVVAGVVVAAWTVLAILQTSVWKNSLTLFAHTAAVTGPNAFAETNLGYALLDELRLSEAVEHLERAVQIDPGSMISWNSLGEAYRASGRPSDAEAAFERAREADPTAGSTWLNFAGLHAEQRRDDLVERDLAEALVRDPKSPLVHLELGRLRHRQKRLEEALKHFDTSVELDSLSVNGWIMRGQVLYDLHRLDDALDSFGAAVNLQPDNPHAHHNLGIVLYEQNKREDALSEFELASVLGHPTAPSNLAATHVNLAIDLTKQGHREDAREHLRRALEVVPGFEPARRELQLLK